MQNLPRISWDWRYDDATRRSAHMVVLADDPDFPILAIWRGTNAIELIDRAQRLMDDLYTGRTTIRRVAQENADVV